MMKQIIKANQCTCTEVIMMSDVLYAPISDTPHYPTPMLSRGIDGGLTGVPPEDTGY